MTPPAIELPKPIALRPHPHLYEINTWAWLEKLSARLGRQINLANVPDAEWDSLARLGFDIVWLMGVWQRSAESRRITLEHAGHHAEFNRAFPGWKPDDVGGSPYSVAQYVPDPRFGGWEGLDAARAKLRARGMALFLDFVGNHTALDHPWTREHPEFYVRGTEEDFKKDPGSFHRIETARGDYFLALGRDPYFPPWTDVAQLNHFSPQMRAAEIAELRTIASHCDGVRCDMAMLHLNDIFGKIWGHLVDDTKRPQQEFWAKAHSSVPQLILLAEAYWGTEARLLDLGFSFSYDKELYDAVRDIRMGDVHARLGAPVEYQGRLARFLENHDEDRAASVFGPARRTAVGTLMGTLPGMRFYYQGELEGSNVREPIMLRRWVEPPADPAATAFFAKILRVTKDDIFHSGEWNLLPVAPDWDNTAGNLVVYEWRSKKGWKVIAVNLASGASQGRVQFGDRAWKAAEYVFYDELDGARYVRGVEELCGLGLFVRREGFDAHLFTVSPA